jgi:hypothetical protein
MTSSTCDHKNAVYTIPLPGLGTFVTRCSACMLLGDVCKNPDISMLSFYEKVANREKPMYVPANPHEAYKMGVENALNLMAAHNFSNPSVTPTLEEIRKALLTEKVTKWANVYMDGTRVSIDPTTFDTRQNAEAGANPKGVPAEIFGTPIGTYQKSVPIEIEVSL